MSNVQVAFGGWVATALRANAADGTAESLGTLTGTIDDNVNAYVAKTAVGQFGVVPKTTPPVGGFTTVNITLKSTSVDGTPLPDVTQAYDLQGSPGGSQAVVLIITSNTPQVGNAPADPGNPTVSLL